MKAATVLRDKNKEFQESPRVPKAPVVLLSKDVSHTPPQKVYNENKLKSFFMYMVSNFIRIFETSSSREQNTDSVLRNVD